MDLILHIILLVGGLVILWKCAELLVAGAVGLAQKLGISSLVVGLTVVAMGTSAPEVAASIAGVLRKAGGGDIAVGNVFGSNIANLALVGGLVALIRPLRVQRKTLFREIPVMLLVALLLWPLLHNSNVSRPEGIILLAVFAVLIFLTVYAARRESKQPGHQSESLEPDAKQETRSVKKDILFVLIGLAGLALGAKMAVEGAVFIGEKIGLSERVIALTVIAFGTSLPELVTCVVAAVKGHHDISVGNLVGSNIFNTLLVTGAAGTVRPFEVGARLAGGVDYWLMIVISVAFAAAVIIGKRVIGRVCGSLLVCTYVGYIIYLLSA
ncbi:MAG TPA: calcium/sodium antiporter [Sedimentisphaerales bacterium]|nr:calcium/sodium antiporter [Sedimentisphaerales bacterium]